MEDDKKRKRKAVPLIYMNGINGVFPIEPFSPPAIALPLPDIPEEDREEEDRGGDERPENA